ncbi:MAG: tRNA (adenosine(37)-N6)-threonylcarbamoyltransferase complex ATPase subunit type 1 TsaE [Gammaproteobacteria bacterium]|nr:tRNA (adenosine(37)-N6)-threonylcarbamoyltransferase complex ATPase subunit type 1 TsaE [Gammaproteobacteria bacterium]
MSRQQIELADEAATLQLGASLASKISTGLVYLQGPLGSGKTTLARGWLRALGHEGPVKSPTYTIVEPYRLRGVDVLHIDLYRIDNSRELDYIGLLEQLELSHLQLVEWPEQGRGQLPPANVVISLATQREGRIAIISYFNEYSSMC